MDMQDWTVVQYEPTSSDVRHINPFLIILGLQSTTANYYSKLLLGNLLVTI